MKKTWMKEELKYLLNNWGEVPLQQIMESLGRTEDSIVRKARRIGLDVKKKKEEQLKRKWTNDEIEFLKNNYKTITSNVIADYVNKTASVVRKKARALGISSTVNHWDEDEEKFLKENWGVICVYSIAKKLKRSRNAVLCVFRNIRTAIPEASGQ